MNGKKNNQTDIDMNMLKDFFGVPVPDIKTEMDKTCQCDCYDSNSSKCNGTRERDYCNCNGDKRKCDFYPTVKTQALFDISSILFKANVNWYEGIGKCILSSLTSDSDASDSVEEETSDSMFDSPALKYGVTFNELFASQMENQQRMLEKGLYNDYKRPGTKTVPVDDVSVASYHIQQLISEVGEVLQADTRWKNMRNKKYDGENKKEEIADCFIVLMNIAMFSGITGTELAEAIRSKINKVSQRIE